MHFKLNAFHTTLSKKRPRYGYSTRRVVILSWFLVTCRLTVRAHGTPATYLILFYLRPGHKS